ncbi:hypothetical protein KKC83_00855 [Patescibacteria group bacterium]|nr:hypothetical protein [Candidatus Falkowbacteria bacterium]MBU3906132.1 hypothetical protein [Patescibacteria group bacterium]MCG2697684.1 hypothetical protein [Candidatus Parcubacteria bacterium]MBU4014949.1 hypothetical protein [Patescibacteria group bacterium]MBU4026080.1 hypothetical protein [Patescibacteria group bacterium]
MRINKKLSAIVSSKIFCLILGFFLASAIIVCATWDEARTTNNTNPNELTEDNWNAFVDMLKLSL